MILGHHVAVSRFRTFRDAIDSVIKGSADVVQMFPNSASDSEIKEAKYLLKKHRKRLVIHASYTINLALDWTPTSWHLLMLEKEFEFASKIGAFGIVVHLGKQLTLSKKQAFNNMYSAIARVLSRTDPNVDLLLETPAGQGTEMCYALEDFGKLFDKLRLLKNRRLGVCVDTCHIFAAGYDIRTERGFRSFLDCFEETVGLKRVRLLHLNDSKKPCGSRLDRHESIGDGEIGRRSLIRFVKFFSKMKIPIVLETPEDNREKEMRGIRKI